MRAGTLHAAAQDRGVPDSDVRTGRQFLNGSVEEGFSISLRNGTYKSTTIREEGSLGSESIYTYTCQFEVRDQCFCTHFTRKGDHSKQQQTAISAFIAE